MPYHFPWQPHFPVHPKQKELLVHTTFILFKWGLKTHDLPTPKSSEDLSCLHCKGAGLCVFFSPFWWLSESYWPGVNLSKIPHLKETRLKYRKKGLRLWCWQNVSRLYGSPWPMLERTSWHEIGSKMTGLPQSQPVLGSHWHLHEPIYAESFQNI